MALATQCPHCYTSFRVANDQLKLYAGMVRCGACKQTFNGIEHLLAPGEPPRTPPSQPAPEAGNSEIDVGSATIVEQPAPLEQSTVPSESNTSDLFASATTSSDELAFDEVEVPVETANFSEVIAESLVDQEPEHHDVPEEFADYLSTSHNQATESDMLPSTVAQTLEDGDQAPSQVEPTATEEHIPSQQELDDIALFQQKLASFAAMVESPPSQDEAELPVAVAPVIDQSNDQEVAEQFSSQLEIIEQDDEEPQAEQAETASDRRRGALTASLDFELSDEERSWQESAQLNQIELETKAAVSAVEGTGYSRHEPSLDETHDEKDALENELHALLSETPSSSNAPTYQAPKKTITPPPSNEPTVSITDPTPHHEDEDQPDFMLQAERAQRYGKWQLAGMYFGVFLLTCLALAQTVYFMRSTIAAHYPEFKPSLVKMCAELHCDIKLPTQIDNIVVEGSELNSLTQDPHVLALSVQLRNKSNMAQTWPMLELILKDSRGKTVLQRVFKPEEYIENKSNISKGIAANSENSFKVHFELTTMKAANYAVEVFYP